MKRLFVAIDLPRGLKKSLVSISSGLEQFRPVPEKQLHITLLFLGDTDESEIPDIIEKLSGISADAYSVYTNGPGAFPSMKNPRVLWIGLKDHGNIQYLQEQISNRLDSYNQDSAEKKYIPHITVARSRKRGSKADEFLNRAKEYTPREFFVDSFQLYESRLSGRGAEHRVLKTFYLD
ncbi:MAG TPA: RNA 2',3'-cyclic phosphodiesterase [Balneolaceae bacterium]|nr:RNA 2',3'-cyclic phosphodiesterase [Balneolaceae bacterium]